MLRLAGVLNVDLPKFFKNFVSRFVQAFRFDFTVTIGLGCIVDGSYIPSVLANIGLVVMVLVAVAVTHVYRMWKIAKGGTDEEVKKEHLMQMFMKFDKDGDGIEIEEMLEICEKIDPDIPFEQVQSIFSKADEDGSGAIDFEEFYGASRRGPYAILHYLFLSDRDSPYKR